MRVISEVRGIYVYLLKQCKDRQQCQHATLWSAQEFHSPTLKPLKTYLYLFLRCRRVSWMNKRDYNCDIFFSNFKLTIVSLALDCHWRDISMSHLLLLEQQHRSMFVHHRYLVALSKVSIHWRIALNHVQDQLFNLSLYVKKIVVHRM